MNFFQIILTFIFVNSNYYENDVRVQVLFIRAKIERLSIVLTNKHRDGWSDPMTEKIKKGKLL